MVAPVEVLRQVPLLAALGEAELEAFAPFLRERRYPRGSMILAQGDSGESLYLIATGQVKVVLIHEDGREVILSVLTEGAFFGEMALLDHEPRSAHVVAMTDATLLQLRREDFQSRLRSGPDVAIGLLRELSRRLRRADETIASLMLLDVNGRIANLLLELADEEGGERITRRLTHATIGQMVGASRETVSRTMRSLVNREILRVSRKEILLLDRGALRLAAQRG